MSVTEVRTLIRDPYAVYARRVLGLNRLPPLRAEPDPAERGNVLHAIVQGFCRRAAMRPIPRRSRPF
ncbi:PD-(D/E)XK nuclease family protein [Paracoccus cavernae]|uniref:PD-(D/E)XK nuclease family protein n=1 Tax=Paracoccus cavernae TaxID=1571207 RepID=A0ABT8DAB5_9RHOB|nr:PD-(D/E)XK nuclease family protein [Paracoccus cavernae]